MTLGKLDRDLAADERGFVQAPGREGRGSAAIAGRGTTGDVKGPAITG